MASSRGSMMVDLDVPSPDRAATLQRLRSRGTVVSDYGFVDLRPDAMARRQSSTAPRSAAAGHAADASFANPRFNSFGGSTGTTPKSALKRRSVYEGLHSPSSAAEPFPSPAQLGRSVAMVPEPDYTADPPARRISAVYAARPSHGSNAVAQSPVGRSFYRRDDRELRRSDLQQDVPFVDFNAPYPYYATEGQRNRGLAHRTMVARGPSPRELVPPSEHRPQPMIDATPMAPLTTVSAMKLREGASSRVRASPYEQSVRDVGRNRGGRTLYASGGAGSSGSTAFSDPVGMEAPAEGAMSPSKLAHSARIMEERRWTSEQWAATVTNRGLRNRGSSNSLSMGGAAAAPSSSTDDAMGHDDSGDEMEDVQFVAMPPTPEEEDREEELRRAKKAASSRLREVSAVPWQFHPAMPVPLSLMLQRGVSIYHHEDLIEYHMHPSFLEDVAFMCNGSTMVKYPRKGGMPHDRFVRIEMMKAGDGDCAFLVWRQHARGVAIIDRVPLSHLVGVTPDDRSQTFERFSSDPKTAEEAARAIRVALKPHDAFDMASPFPHNTMEETGPDTTMTAAVPRGTMLVGPVIEDLRRKLVPRNLCLSFWFVNPSTGEPRSVDLVAPNRGTWARWVDGMSAIVSINSISAAPAMDEVDRRVYASLEGALLGTEDRLGGRLTEPISASRGALNDGEPIQRTDELLQYAIERLDRTNVQAEAAINNSSGGAGVDASASAAFRSDGGSPLAPLRTDG